MTTVGKSCSTSFKKWFPYQALANLPEATIKGRIIAFHSAGSDASIFLSSVIRRHRVENELVNFCKARDIQLLCPLLPGRSFRHEETVATSTIPSLSREIFEVCEPLLQDPTKPYFLAAHSFGCIFLFCFLEEVLKRRILRPPSAIFITASISPCRPVKLRPWQQVAGLSDSELKLSLAKWNITDDALTPQYWSTLKPMIFNDLDLLDRCPALTPLQWNGQKPLLCLIRGKNDPTITEGMLKGEINAKHLQHVLIEWANAYIPTYTEFDFKEIDGDHAIFYNANSRSQWNRCVIDIVDQRMIQKENDSPENMEEFGF